MDRSDTSEYYARRATQARDLADRAASAAVRAIHLNMAERYARLAARPEPERPVLLMVDGDR